MTRREAFDHLRWAAYARELADRVCLRDWAIGIGDETPKSHDAVATCEPLYGQRFATICLSDAFFSQPEESQRQTMTHELVHCHLATLQHFQDRTLAESDTGTARLLLEYAVDGLTAAIAPHMPLPSQVKKDEAPAPISLTTQQFIDCVKQMTSAQRHELAQIWMYPSVATEGGSA